MCIPVHTCPTHPPAHIHARIRIRIRIRESKQTTTKTYKHTHIPKNIPTKYEITENMKNT